MMVRVTFARVARRLLLIGLLITEAWILARAPLPVAQASGVPRPVEQRQVVGEGPNRAALVVRYADDSIQTRCVAFSETDISGDELLERSGLESVVSPEGAICSIGSVGCPSDDCFCECPYPDCLYWAYYHWQNGAWSYSNVGAFSHVVSNGALEGWSWGQGDFQQSDEPPPMISFEEICPAAADAEGTATPTPTATTQADDSPDLPQVTFQASASQVSAGQCTALYWQAINAISVSIEGKSVELQGSRQECPTATRVWTLVATNAAGQITRQVTVHVAGATATQTPKVTVSPGATGSQRMTPTSTVASTSTRAPRPLPVTAQPQQGVAIVQSPVPVMSPVVPSGTDLIGGVPLAPTADPLAVVTSPPQPTPTRFTFHLPPTATPRSRRALGAGGRPTPTPILLARVPAVPSSGESARQNAGVPATGSNAARQLAESRSFNPQLLPGYAAYFLTLAVLIVIGWYVLRRKNGHRLAPTRGLAQDVPTSSHEVQVGGRESTAQEP
jgi:hypothetical protein